MLNVKHLIFSDIYVDFEDYYETKDDEGVIYGLTIILRRLTKL